MQLEFSVTLHIFHVKVEDAITIACERSEGSKAGGVR
jgi:hypothetical protein